MTVLDEQFKSDHILDEIKRHARTKEVVDVDEELVKVVIFTSGKCRYAFYGNDIKEVLPACDVSWVPCLPEYLPGLINVRGDIESLIDIRFFLGEGKTDPAQCLIVIAAQGDFRSGIMIDSIDDVADIPAHKITPPLSTLNGAARDLVIGEIEHGGTVTLLDVGKLASKVSV